jgi:hypothetical protein
MVSNVFFFFFQRDQPHTKIPNSQIMSLKSNRIESISPPTSSCIHVCSCLNPRCLPFRNFRDNQIGGVFPTDYLEDYVVRTTGQSAPILIDFSHNRFSTINTKAFDDFVASTSGNNAPVTIDFSFNLLTSLVTDALKDISIQTTGNSCPVIM